MFHIYNGLYFERDPDGCVTVIKKAPGDCVIEFQQSMSGATWASVVLSMSAFGERPGDWDKWIAHHAGRKDMLAAPAVRMARCHCGSTVPSSQSLPFFQDRSYSAQCVRGLCACGYLKCAHDATQMKSMGIRNGTVIERGLCAGFRPHPGMDTDSYECGCKGFD